MNHNYASLSSVSRSILSKSRTVLIALFCFVYSTNWGQITYSFTNAGATASLGPTQSAVNSAYASTNLNGQVTVSGGIQSWTVPATGAYRIEAYGAKGGNSAGNIYIGGSGAKMSGDFTLTAGAVVQVLVGQMGNNGTYVSYYPGGGGGGGSFVRVSGTLAVAAGGGGGAGIGESGYGGYAGAAGQTITSGSAANGYNSSNGSPGTSGFGGTGGSWYAGAGGGGYSGNGSNSSGGSISYGGLSYLSGGTGGAPGVYTYGGTNTGGCGGFGGGGGAMFGGGGGGGYSGGAGGCHTGSSGGTGGGGGGSFNSGTSQLNSIGVNSSHGFVLITRLVGVNIVQAAPIQCNGMSNAVLTASMQGGTPPYTYTWFPGSSNSQTLTGLGAGSYTCVATDGASATYTTVFNVTQPPVLTASVVSQSSTTCNGGSNASVYMAAQGGVAPYTYTWYPYGGNSSSATGLSAGVYTLELKDNSSCVSQATVNILQPPPVQIVAFASKQSICFGESVTLLGGGANYYSWSGGVTNGVAFSPASTASYVVTGTNSQGCTGSAFTTVSVSPSPTVSASGPATVCAGTSITLTASGASTYTWSNMANGPATVDSPTVTTSYTVSGSNSFNCAHNAVVLVTVYALPNVVASISSSAVCAGQPVTFNASGASTYSWSSGISGGIPFYLSSSGMYTVTGTDANGCINSDTKSVTVNPLPVINVAGPSTLCAFTNTTLVASGASVYAWSIGGSSATLNISPASNITYSVTGTDANGCQAGTSHSIGVIPSPVVTAAATSASFCAGAQATLSAAGAVSYTWMPGNINGPTLPVSPSVTTVYTVTGTGSNNCSASVSLSLAVAPLPSLSISGPTFVCSGTTLTMSVAGAQSYTWSTGANSATLVVTPTAASVYSVSGTGANGCVGDVVSPLVVGALPVLNAAASQSMICVGGSAMLSAGGALSYQWLPSNVTTPSITVTPSASVVYTINGTGSNGCKATSTLQLIVNALPVVSISGNTLVCEGYQTILTGMGASSYTWNGSVSGPTLVVSPSVQTVYSVTALDTNGCAGSSTIKLNVLPSPKVQLSSSSQSVCAGETVTLSAQGGLSYTWSTSQDTSSSTTHAPIVPLTYTVTGSSANGCNGSATLYLQVDPCTAISEYGFSGLIPEVFPNPSSGEFSLRNVAGSEILIYSAAGQLVAAVPATAETERKIQLAGAAKGIYLIVIRQGTSLQHKKIVIN